MCVYNACKYEITHAEIVVLVGTGEKGSDGYQTRVVSKRFSEPVSAVDKYTIEYAFRLMCVFVVGVCVGWSANSRSYGCPQVRPVPIENLASELCVEIINQRGAGDVRVCVS